MDEAECLADRIAVIAQGEIVAEGTPATLGGRDRAATEIAFTLPSEQHATTFLQPPVSSPSTGSAIRRLLRVTEPMPVLHALSSWAVERGYDLADITVRRPTLEDTYLRLTREDV